MKKVQIAIVAICAVFTMGFASQVDADAAIGNTVWNDHNKNGIQDPGEPGIPGVKIKLYNGDDVEKDKTNSRGRYKFKDLDPGHYTIVVAQETLPEGCYATYDRDGNKNGRYSDKYLKDDDYYTHADFGYHCPTIAPANTNRVSPVTGPGVMTVILSIAAAFGVGAIVYKKRSQN